MSTDPRWDVVAGTNLGTLATIKRDGRPQLSDVNYTVDPQTHVVRISTRSSLAKTHNVRRDPRVSLKVTAPGNAGYVVVEGTAELSPVSSDEHDATVAELIEMYRLIGGKEHPDWDDYRRAMVADGRVVLRILPEKLYGWVLD
jgi:PPOX class probable F420-dependent enzyme